MRLKCGVCRKTWERPAQRGRPPTKCPKCRGVKPAEEAATGSARTGRPASPVRAGAAESTGLAASIERAKACLEWVRGYPGWEARGFQRAKQAVAGVEATREVDVTARLTRTDTVRMEWRNGIPITDADSFKQAIRASRPAGKTKRASKSEPPPARAASTVALDRLERTAEACRELAAWCRERGWRTEAGWTRRGQTGGAGKVVATHNGKSLVIWFENGQPQSNLATFRKQVANV